MGSLLSDESVDDMQACVFDDLMIIMMKGWRADIAFDVDSSVYYISIFVNKFSTPIVN